MEMPKYLFSKRFLTESVLTILIFSVPFLLIYKPFSQTIWLGFGSPSRVLFTLVFYLLAIGVMALSKMAIYRFQEKHVLTLGRFVLWVFSEYLLVGVIYLALTPVVTGYLAPVSLNLVFKTALCVGLILVIPYGYMCLYAAYKALQEEYEALKASSMADAKAEKVMLYDYKGEPTICLDADSIYFIEAQDNYVQIYYESEGKEQKYMLRCPTQKLEPMLAGTTLVRCHRSCIVNLAHMDSLVRGHNCATIILDNAEKKEVSVSKSYYKQTLARMQDLDLAQGKFIKRT